MFWTTLRESLNITEDTIEVILSKLEENYVLDKLTLAHLAWVTIAVSLYL